MSNDTMSYCTNCGKSIRQGAKFCNYCATPVAPAAPAQPAPHVPPPAAPAQTPPPPPPAGYAASTTPLQVVPTTQALSSTSPQPVRPIVSAAEDKTQALPVLQNGFTLLPAGAVLGSGQNLYVVLDGKVDEPDVRHVYTAEAWPSPAAAARYLIMEVHDPILVDRERELVNRKLPENGLLLPVAAFSDQLWEETPRYYLVYPEKLAANLKSASSLPRPQPLEKTLRWGAMLASGLHTLHNKQLAHNQVNPQNIVVNDWEARLSGFENVKTLQKMSGAEKTHWQQRDIADLATSLLDLLGGPRAVLPAEIVSVLQQGQGKPPAQPYLSAAVFGQALTQALDNLKPSDLKVREGHATNVGKVRDHNEDNVAVMEKALLSGKIPLTYGIYIVADGMGGHAAGEVASNLAIDAAMDVMSKTVGSLQQMDGSQMQAIARQACLAANQAVYNERTRRGSDMGTTIVAALRIGDRVAVGNIGDSRAYLINAQAIKPITIDHSLVQRLIDTGQISPAEARAHPQRNLIYKVVGDKPTIEPDAFDVRMQPGDRLLLCSDGLWEMVEDPEIWQAVLSQQDPQLACDQLIRLANQAGGEDNITAIIVQAVGP